MKYFAGVGGVNRLLNEASLPGRVIKISDEEENHCVMTCGGTVTRAHAHARTHVWTAVIVPISIPRVPPLHYYLISNPKHRTKSITLTLTNSNLNPITKS